MRSIEWPLTIRVDLKVADTYSVSLPVAYSKRASMSCAITFSADARMAMVRNDLIFMLKKFMVISY